MDVQDWLLAGDPAIRWQVLQDLTDTDADQVARERAAVATTGWGWQLLDLESGGRWADGACFPARSWAPPPSVVGSREAQPWTSTYPTLRLLREFGVPVDHEDVIAMIERVRRNCRWEYDDSAFFAGEVEPCINGGTVVIGSYFGQDVDAIVQRLIIEQLDDGGWNCEATLEEGHAGSTRSSFHATICVLEGLAAYRGSVPVDAARCAGEEYLLKRNLMRRLSTGELVDHEWQQFSFPVQWHYDVLRGLDHFRTVNRWDPRLTEAVDLVRSKQQPDGRWLLENTHAGMQWFELDEGDGHPSRWNTLRALRVLHWADAAAA